MASLRIPDTYQPGIEKLARVSDELVQSLLNALTDAPPALRPADLASSVTSKLEGVDSADVEDIIESVVSLYSVREALGLSVEQMVEDIREAVVESEDFPDYSEEEQARLKRRLTDFLSFDGVLGVVSKAIGVLLDHERTFVQARILTDIRPVFKTEPDQDPAGVVIVHTLKIEYHEGRSHKDIFIALETSHLRTLRALLDRADSKTQTLKSLLDKTGVPNLDVD